MFSPEFVCVYVHVSVGTITQKRITHINAKNYRLIVISQEQIG